MAGPSAGTGASSRFTPAPRTWWTGIRMGGPTFLSAIGLLRRPIASALTARVPNRTATQRRLSSVATAAPLRYIARLNLIADDANGTFDIFVHDLTTGSTEAVSIDETGAPGNRLSIRPPAISGDGRFVAFISYADLISGLNGEQGEVYVRDLLTDTTELISVNTAGNPSGVECSDPGISDDGRYVTFWSQSPNLVASDTNGFHMDAFVRDRTAGTTEVVTRNSNGQQTNSWGDEGDDPGVGGSAISDDGRFVAFLSVGENLVPGDTNDAVDVFRRDLVDGTTIRLSEAGDGTQANGGAGWPVGLTSDGSMATFQSRASNLVAGDNNGVDDIFLWGEAAPATVPGVPPNVTAAAGDAQASVSWSPPSSDGGSEITSYRIDGTSGAGNTVTTVNGAETSRMVSGLTTAPTTRSPLRPSTTLAGA